MKGVIFLSYSSKKSPKKDKKSKLKPRNINVTYPGVLDHKGWREFKTSNIMENKSYNRKPHIVM